MGQDSSLLLRQAIVTHLKADASVTSLLTPGGDVQVHGERSGANPVFPFTRFGSVEALPERAQCWDGSRISFPIHSFSKSPFTDEVHAIDAALAASLDGRVLALDGGGKAHISWVGTQLLPDPTEADVFHGIVRFEATVT